MEISKHEGLNPDWLASVNRPTRVKALNDLTMCTYSLDTLFDKSIRIKQNKNGYRFSIDPVLLAHFATPEPGDRLVDLGTGCGIIPIALLYRNPEIHVTGVEIQPGLAKLSKENIFNNQLEKKITIVCGDIASPDFVNSLDGPYDMVVSNPPYTEKNSGRINPNCEKAIARHEIAITLEQLLNSSSVLLKNGGRFIAVYPQARLVDLLSLLRKKGIEPKKLRMVHPKKENQARLVLVEGVKGGGPGLVVEKPLYIYQSDNRYSDEIKKMFQGD